MKNFSKITSVTILAAAAALFISTATGDEIVIKPLRYQAPTKSLFTEKVAATPAVTCTACRNEFAPTVTQDSKLKTKTVLAASHACNECKTTIVRTGAQKATGKDVARHSCGALLAAAETCCGGMK
jgi:hypothetical protein